MTNIIEHTYTALANTGELRLTEKDYRELLCLFEEHWKATKYRSTASIMGTTEDC